MSPSLNHLQLPILEEFSVSSSMPHYTLLAFHKPEYYIYFFNRHLWNLTICQSLDQVLTIQRWIRNYNYVWVHWQRVLFYFELLSIMIYRFKQIHSMFSLYLCPHRTSISIRTVLELTQVQLKLGLPQKGTYWLTNSREDWPSKFREGQGWRLILGAATILLTNSGSNTIQNLFSLVSAAGCLWRGREPGHQDHPGFMSYSFHHWGHITYLSWL